MHPNTFLRSFWNMAVKPQVFVAMSFAPAYEDRWKNVIQPAITDIAVNGVALNAIRVDLSRSGDSILSDIADGIVHSRFILADVSTLGRDAVSGRPYRNGNVMYEVGVALAARHPSDVLLVRDDDDPLLFDVTAIPHARINFVEVEGARMELGRLLSERLREQERVKHAKIEMAISALSAEELSVIEKFGDHTLSMGWNYQRTGSINFEAQVALPRLLDKGMIVLRGKFDDGNPCYSWTELGLLAAQVAKKGLPQFKIDKADKLERNEH